MTNLDERLVVGDASLGSAVGCSRRGSSHVREAKPCQDAWAIWSGAVAGSPCLITAVADGHGDDRHKLSHFGAAFAVKAAVDALLSVLTSCGLEAGRLAFKRSFKADFPRRVVRRWREAVLADAKERHPEALDSSGESNRLFVEYGTTLLAALVTEDVLLLGQLGDGAVFVVRPNGTVEPPFPEPADNIGPVTNSLCSADAPNLWRTTVLDRAAGGTLFLATDGLVNAFPNNEQLHKFARSLRERVQEFGLDRVAAALPGWLDHYSAEGSGDDITLAVATIVPLISGDAIAQGTGQAEASTNQLTEETPHVITDRPTSEGRDGQHKCDREEEVG